MQQEKTLPMLVPEQDEVHRSILTRLEAVPGAFVNLTDLPVDPRMAALMSYGPGFRFPSDISERSTLDALYDVGYVMGREVGHPLLANFNMKEVYTKYAEDFDNFISSAVQLGRSSHINHILREAVSVTKQFFQNHAEVVVIQADKGRKTALLYKDAYLDKMQRFMNDSVKDGVFTPIEDFNKYEQVVKSSFRRLRKYLLAAYGKTTFFSNRLRTDLLKDGPYQLPTLYGTIKCHKVGNPIRPICASHSWYSRPIQRIVTDALTKGLGERLCKNNVKNVRDIVPIIYNIPVMGGYVWAKFDVRDMYTNMDREEIFRLLSIIIHHTEFKEKCKFDTDLLQSLIHFSLDTSNYVAYDGKVYKRNRGLPQGACDSGLYATIYLDYLLQSFSDTLFKNNFVYHWFKYMDDFLLYIPKNNISHFKREFEDITKLELDLEEETLTGDVYNISFLSLNIYRTATKMEVGSYRKECASLRTINYLSNTPKIYKTNMIITFVRDIVQFTCNSRLLIDLDNLYLRLRANSYPVLIIWRSFTSTILKYITDLRRGEHVIPLDPAARIFRINTLLCYLKQNQMYISSYRTTTSSTSEGSKKNISRSIVYNSYCIPFSKLIRDIHKHNNLAAPVFRSSGNNYKQLGADTPQAMSTNNKKILTQNSLQEREAMGLTRCGDCNEFYILHGFGCIEDILRLHLEDRNSIINQHLIQYEHQPPSCIYPLSTRTTTMSTSTQRQVYKALFHAKGISCTSSRELSEIPSYIRGVIKHLTENHKLPVGLPTDRVPTESSLATSQQSSIDNNIPGCSTRATTAIPEEIDDNIPSCSIQTTTSIQEEIDDNIPSCSTRPATIDRTAVPHNDVITTNIKNMSPSIKRFCYEGTSSEEESIITIKPRKKIYKGRETYQKDPAAIIILSDDSD